ncbi:MAG: 50S ribosomal protein L18 [Candidatus Magasanikbacteria bacterium RIFCSPHIGHO2_01_FULL_50_8]|uniref:Large ribosomal subunit protein uL18 n=1 Tax=Candidatus Magasanikbacteria bacterium RIFCSPHIGHO2_01_FULL_50_8 TaxID=1798674 RepID=A0A1F6LR64_9BACT|nr:MAG: 50S ribosomal protein L18 [Candidatus Magasanikbacteria bacterium RIFCSPHIGHO2_01_FULL_50_8]
MKESPTYKHARRDRRRTAIRAKIIGSAECPRLSVYRSLSQINAQLLDDASGKTIAAVATAGLKGDAGERTGKVAESYLGGLKLAELAKAKKVLRVVFDRGGFRYHGRVAAFAEGARAGGLEF